MTGPGGNMIRFEEFELDTDHRTLFRDGEQVPIYAKTFDLLVFLLTNSGRIVNKDEILDNVWEGQSVEEGNLTVQISALRKALGESKDKPRFLVTVPGKGYKFLVTELRNGAEAPAVEPVEIHPASEPRTPVGHPRTRRAKIAAIVIGAVLVSVIAVAGYFYYSYPVDTSITSIAVLPFTAQGQDVDYLGEGLAESVTYSLSGLSGLRVMSRHSAFRYKGKETDARSIGRELGIDAILTGRVSVTGDAVSVSTELISTSDNSVIWGERFDRNGTDLARVESDIATAIAARLRLKLLAPTGPTARVVDPEAYKLYLLGRYHLNQLTDDGFRKCAEYFQKAIDLQPDYALAYAGLAEAHHRLSGWNAVSPHGGFPKARDAALKALELDPSLASAHASLGTVKELYDWDWPGAEMEFRRAIDLDPNSADARQMYGYYLSAMGKFDEALTQMKLAKELDPLSIEKSAAIGEIHFLARRYDEAVAEFRRALEMDSNSGYGHWTLGRALLEKGSHDEAIASLHRAVALSGDSPDEQVELARAFARSGRKDETRKIIDDLRAASGNRYVAPAAIGSLYAEIGDLDAAFEWLERAIREKDFLVVLLNVEPMFDSLRSDARFDLLLQRINLPYKAP